MDDNVFTNHHQISRGDDASEGCKEAKYQYWISGEDEVCVAVLQSTIEYRRRMWIGRWKKRRSGEDVVVEGRTGWWSKRHSSHWFISFRQMMNRRMRRRDPITIFQCCRSFSEWVVGRESRNC